MNLPAVSRADWAERINARWQTSLTAILETGRLIGAAKESLPQDEFDAMIATDLRFSGSTARRLIIVAEDPRLSDGAHVHILPPHWGTLYELTKLEDDVFEAKIADGTIRADMQRRDIATTVKVARRAEREDRLAKRQRALPDKRYGVILADPEWRFEPWSRKTGLDRAADNHYPTSVTDVIASRPVATIAHKHCVLFLWATAPMLPHALAVMEAWGFEYKTNLVWDKSLAGTGYWFRNRHEHLLVGTCGHPPAPAPGEQEHSIIAGQRTAHSAKSEKFYRLIELYFPNLPKIELNARQRRPGWDAWGNEVPPHDPETGEVLPTPSPPHPHPNREPPVERQPLTGSGYAASPDIAKDDARRKAVEAGGSDRTMPDIPDFLRRDLVGTVN